MRKKYVVLGILLFVIIAIAVPVSYFVAMGVVDEAVRYKLHIIEGSGSIQSGLTDVKFAGNFNFTSRADIPLTLDRVNITVYIFDTDRPYDGDLDFDYGLGVYAYTIGSALIENELVPAKGQLRIPVSFDVTSEDALNVIQSGNYSVGWYYSERTVSGTYLFWHFTPQIAFQ